MSELDVSGLTLAAQVHIPGNVLKGNWRAKVYVDDKATPQQEEAILNLYTGKLGGPVADLVELIGEVAGVERAPITFELKGIEGTLRIGQAAEAQLVPYGGATGQPSALHDTIFTTVPGAPAYVGKASSYESINPSLGHNINIQDHNAISGPFRFQG